MSKFARLFTLSDGGQVLLSLVEDESLGYGIETKTRHNGLYLGTTSWFSKEARAVEYMEKYTNIEAEKFRENVIEASKEVPEHYVLH